MNTLAGARPTRPASISHPSWVERDDARRDPHKVMAAHRPNPDGTACTACGVVYTTDRPLCPPVADALRALVRIDRTPRPQSSLSSYSTSKLRVMAREHTGQGRCRRCGFVYSGPVRTCPTARRIATELESRSKAHVTAAGTDQGLCAGKGKAWTVTGHDAARWKRSIAACSLCPLLAQCQADLENRLAAGGTVYEQIIAGRVFTAKGVEVHDVERLAAHRRPGTPTTQPRPTEPEPVPPRPAPAPGSRQLELFEVSAA